ncbi:hypothetical protein [Tenacibaculum sp. 190524A05c]|uniref:Uncharacterized protein n=1 Tax=Tenacibaculum platacis TaxID=3137852 RepID=A0ABP1EWB8_9FLAO
MIDTETLKSLGFQKSKNQDNQPYTTYLHSDRPYSIQVLNEHPIIVKYNKGGACTGFVEIDDFITWHNNHPY